jgi:hypothetical protein
MPIPDQGHVQQSLLALPQTVVALAAALAVLNTNV